MVPFRGGIYCTDCAAQLVQEALAGVVLTTTPSMDGYQVKRYLGIESVEIVIGTGMWSEFTGGIADLLGARTTAFEEKMQNAKVMALQKLQLLAAEKGANAVIGIDLDYTEFSGNRIGVIANGTLVEIVPMAPAPV
jgi:uncharacterized protein YbjQ (UPF0145 family)